VSYGAVAKTLHWVVAAILVVQFAIGWLMPGVKRGMQPGLSTHTHISIGIVVLALILVRLFWRLTHRVPPLTGWFYASARGWALSFFGLFPLAALVAQGSPTGSATGEIHQVIVWVLLAVVAMHVAAALMHAFVYRDRVMQRMLFSKP